MPAYLIAHVDVRDPAHYREYMLHTPRIVAQYGGRFIVRGGRTETLEGPERSVRIVVAEFPSLDAVRTFYHSPEYTAARALRAAGGTAHFVAVEGYPEDEWHKALAASAKLSLP